MHFEFLKSKNRYYYIFASLRFRRMPWTVYDVIHCEECQIISRNRDIYDDYCRYRWRKKKH